MNKRGQLTTMTIILIILGLVVLAALIYFFVLGGNKLTPFLNTGDNVQTIVTQCSTYCSVGSNYDYCTKQMTINANGKAYNSTCSGFSDGAASVSPGANNAKFSPAEVTTVKGFKVASCPSITC